MKFTNHQKEIIKKIASGEITDIVSYIRVFNLSTLRKFDKEEIKKRFEEDENGKTYRKLKPGIQTGYYSETRNTMNLPIGINYIPIIPKEEDFEEVPARLSYDNSYYTVEVADGSKYKYDYFQGINIINSFSDIKNFLIVWQYLKSEGLVLEVNKKISASDYELFFEYKEKVRAQSENNLEKAKMDFINSEAFPLELKEVDIKNIFPRVETEKSLERDFQCYTDYYFEYNKANEMLCS